MKYDSLLYGNGLSIHTLAKIQEQEKSPFSKYLKISNFIIDFSTFPDHSVIVRNFENKFSLNQERKETHNLARKTLADYKEEINRIGFELWGSKYLFRKPELLKQLKIYIYILYNYYFDYINKEFLQKKLSQNIIERISQQVKSHCSDTCKFFTLNFDPIHDPYLCPDHLHGRFLIPFDDMSKITFHEIDYKYFEYPFLFATNGLEKLSRLSHIKDVPNSPYDLNFFYDNN